ncbi:MAG: hypothetical protein CSB13_01830 [Chloroflexi bacterium]|nr:MAG: hypothetical protein CSB13_01830 [Chloroflexota bacterium]
MVLVTAVTACHRSPTAPATPTKTAVALVPVATHTAALPPTVTITATPVPPAKPSPDTATAPLLLDLLTATAPGHSHNQAYPYPAQASPPPATAAPTATATNTPTPTPTPTPIPTIDFAAVKADLQMNGQDIGYAKIGFHVGIGGNTEGLEQWMRDLDAAGVPFFLKSVDNAEPLYFAQELMKESGIPHTLVFRTASGGFAYNVPNYDLPPAIAAQEHWQRHRDAFPPELDPNYVWIETVNEVDKNRSEWLAQFSLETANLTMRDGFKWAAFGWSSGEPEPDDWQQPAMLAFLRLAGENPDKLAIALHEYSYLVDDITDIYPYKVGRFQELYRLTDAHNIPRPTILITEWGWTYEHVPEPESALADVAWASALYAPYPQVKGAAIWYLGYGDTFGSIADEAQQLIDPVRLYALTNYFVIPLPPEQQPINPEQHSP